MDDGPICQLKTRGAWQAITLEQALGLDKGVSCVAPNAMAGCAPTVLGETACRRTLSIAKTIPDALWVTISTEEGLSQRAGKMPPTISLDRGAKLGERTHFSEASISPETRNFHAASARSSRKTPRPRTTLVSCCGPLRPQSRRRGKILFRPRIDSDACRRHRRNA